MSEISVGVVGCGGIAQVAHLPVLSRTEGVEVVALCDNDIGKARALGERFGVSDIYDDLEDLLKEAKPDAVAICTPNHMHESHVQISVASGIHVLCERPLATDVASVESIVKAHDRADTVLMVGFNARYRSDVQVIRGYLDRGELGTLRSIRTGYYYFRPSRTALGWRLSRNKSGGGVMLDLGLSLIDLSLWLGGYPDPVRVTGSYSWDEERKDIEDSGCALIECESGLSIFADVSWRYVGEAEKFWFEILGSGGSASLAPLHVYRELNGRPVEVTPSGARSENQFTISYKAEWANFLAAVRGEVEPPALADQITMHRVLEAVNNSVTERRDVSL